MLITVTSYFAVLSSCGDAVISYHTEIHSQLTRMLTYMFIDRLVLVSSCF